MSKLLRSPNSKITKIFMWLGALAVAAFNLTVSPAKAAERIEFSYGALEIGVSVDELETYTKEDRIGKELNFFLSRVGESDRQYVREFLTLRNDFSALQVSQFFYSTIGEQVIGYLGDLVQTDGNLNGAKAIRAGLILAASDEDGLSLLNFVKKFPSRTMYLDVAKGLEVSDKIGNLSKATESVVSGVEKLASEVAKSEPKIEPQLGEVASSGKYPVKVQTENWKDTQRNRQLTLDLYLPQGLTAPAPVIVLSHGLASNRQHFAAIAQYLASYGFVAVTLEHPGSNTEKLQKLLQGLTKEVFDVSEFSDRPKDVSFVLSAIAQRFPRSVNVQQAGVIGHSFGGYTALALAGATIDFDYLTKECGKGFDSANVSLILQCQALKLPRQAYNFRDNRIKFALAINPIDSSIFGQKGLSQIQIPVAIAASSEDSVASVVLEQVKPFSWMTAPDRYLLVVRGVGHVADIRDLIRAFVPSLVDFIPNRNTEPLKAYASTFVLALVETHVRNRQEYRPYLQSNYAIARTQAPNKISILRSLTPAQFNAMLP